LAVDVRIEAVVFRNSGVEARVVLPKKFSKSRRKAPTVNWPTPFR